LLSDPSLGETNDLCALSHLYSGFGDLILTIFGFVWMSILRGV
jgi:hypothetical protein